MPRRVVYLILGLVLVRGLLYVSLIPPWQSPDEEFHFAQARLLLPARDGANGSDWQQDLLDSLEAFRFYELVPHAVPPAEIPLRYSQLERNTPAYWLYALAALPWTGQGVLVQLYAMRLVSVLTLVGTTALVYLAGRELFPEDGFVPIVASLLLVFVPGHTHLNAAVNDGNLTELAASLTLFFLAQAMMRGYSPANLIAVLASLALAMWSKQTAYFLAVVVITALAFTLFQRQARDWRVWAGVLAGIIALGVVAWQVAAVRAIFAGLEEAGRSLINDPGTADKFWLYWQGGYRSLWAGPGWQVGVDHHWWDGPALIFSGLSLAGALWFTLRPDPAGSQGSRPRLIAGLLGFALFLAVLELFLINAFLLTLSPGVQGVHGRYLYVAALPFAILVAIGWRQFVPEAWRKATMLAFFVIPFAFDASVLLTYLLPFFYPLR